MCMHKTEFSLQFNKNTKTYYGIGYKYIETPGRLGRWKEATGSYNTDSSNLKLAKKEGMGYIKSNDNRTYLRGFHIFVNKGDVIGYAGTENKENIYKVHYKEVLGFGTNRAGRTGDGYPNYGLCVIARYIKVVERA